MLFNLANILVFLGVAAGFILVVLAVGKLIRPSTPDAVKSSTYECGEKPVIQAWFNFNPRFYIIAIVFLIFDVEVAFTYPVITVLRGWIARGLGVYAVLELAVFLVVLAVGLGYVWRKGDLEWIRAIAGGSQAEPKKADETPAQKAA